MVVSVIAHDIRSTHNIGSILRTADCLGAEHVYIGGISPYPKMQNDERLPHISDKLNKQISKTSLGAENYAPWSIYKDINELIHALKSEGTIIVALEQSSNSVLLNSTRLQEQLHGKRIAIFLGREVEGIEKDLLSRCDITIEIPMHGKKESLNVANAFAIALYALKEL